MYFQRFYDTRLAQASYLIGCQLTGDAQGGARSPIAASVLQTRGIRNVVNLVGGYAAWERAGLPTTRDAVESVS
jgi:3-mercaptopyruvate sulfurtransferase SseA